MSNWQINSSAIAITFSCTVTFESVTASSVLLCERENVAGRRQTPGSAAKSRARQEGGPGHAIQGRRRDPRGAEEPDQQGDRGRRRPRNHHQPRQERALLPQGRRYGPAAGLRRHQSLLRGQAGVLPLQGVRHFGQNKRVATSRRHK
jgi:hypothetical protein